MSLSFCHHWLWIQAFKFQTAVFFSKYQKNLSNYHKCSCNTVFLTNFLLCFTNQSVQMSLSFCHHWSWIQTLKRPPYMIRGHVFFCQGRHPQGWWRYPAPGAHSLCCPRKTECCWNRDSVVPRRHFEGLKRPPRIRLKDSLNWLILIIPAMVWQVLKMRCIEWPDTEMMWIYKKNARHFEGLNWSELSTHVFTNLWIFYKIECSCSLH